jgi:hypothetical protein
MRGGLEGAVIEQRVQRRLAAILAADVVTLRYCNALRKPPTPSSSGSSEN